MTDAHTPGPWSAAPQRAGHRQTQTIYYRVNSAAGRWLARVYRPENEHGIPNIRQQIANAALMADAPMLLAALRRMVTAYEDLEIERECSGCFGQASVHDPICEARSVLRRVQSDAPKGEA